MLIFHEVHWLHLLVFIRETTTKNLQLLQPWVTNTLSCVWLWSTYTFLVEEMKRHQAAIRKHHARPATPNSSNVKKSPLSHGSSAASLCVLEPAVQPTAAWSQESAGNKGGTLFRMQPNECSLLMSPSDSGQDKARDTLICCHLRQWLADPDGGTASVHYQGSLQEHCCHTLINYLRKLPDVLNIDFNSRKRIYQKGLLVFMQILTADLTPRTPVSAKPLLLYQKDKSEKQKYKTGKNQHLQLHQSLQLQQGTNSDHPHACLN